MNETKRFYVVLEIEAPYEGSTQDVALWIDSAMGRTRSVESEVFDNFDDLLELESFEITSVPGDDHLAVRLKEPIRMQYRLTRVDS